jgi:F-type H+-transporting ATPase subunit delta
VEEIAQVYARALWEVASEHDHADEIREQLGEFADAVAENRDLQVFLFSPYFSTDEKKEGLHKAVTGADENLANFLDALIEKHRMPAIFRIRRQYDVLWREANRLLPVQITSAIDLDEQTVKRIGDEIGEQTGQKIELNAEVDPEILGGIVVRVGNSILDASIRNRLEQLRKQVATAAA